MPSLLHERISELRDELFAFLRRRTSEPDDLAQETWIRVAEADPHCPDEHRFRAYAYTVARRLLIDHHRKRARGAVLVSIQGGIDGGLDFPGGELPDGGLRAGEALVVVERALAAMKPEVAEVFRLRMTSDLSFKQIAIQQAVSLNTALGRHHHATKQIAQALREHGLIDDEGPSSGPREDTP